MELRFEWDKRKNTANIKKHGVSFEDAALVFKDTKRLEMYDKKNSIFEDRWKTVGFYTATLLTVITTERSNSVRIISAREASKKEKEEYFYGY